MKSITILVSFDPQAQVKAEGYTRLPEHSDAISVMDSLCSSNTSDSIMLLPLLGMSNTSMKPVDTPVQRSDRG